MVRLDDDGVGPGADSQERILEMFLVQNDDFIKAQRQDPQEEVWEDFKHVEVKDHPAKR